jgi:hypothetical protein
VPAAHGRRCAARLVPAALVAALAGCGGGGDEPRPRTTATPASPAERPEPSDEAQIADLLRDRAAALEAGRVRAYAKTATGAQRRRDRVHARRAGRLRLADVQLDLGPVNIGERRARARIMTSYEIAGVRGEFRLRRPLTVVQTANGWRVARLAGSRGLPPWEVGPFVQRRSRHFVLLAPPGVDLQALIGSLEDGYAAMDDKLPNVRLRRRYFVVVAAGTREGRALTRGIRGIGSLSALVDANLTQTGPALRTSRVEGLRLVILWPAVADYDAYSRGLVITHELTHAALAAETSGRVPGWLTEGVALYVSGDRRASPGADLRALSGPDSIGRLTGADQTAAYGAASAAAYAIADRYGEHALLRLHRSFNSTRLRGRPGPRLVDRALRRELGMSLGELDALV